VRKLSSLILGLSLSVLSGCILQTREDLEKQNEDRQLKEQVSSIQKSKADTEVRYGDLENEIRVLSGRIETLEHNQQVYHQTNVQDTVAVKKAIEAQNDKSKLIEQRVDSIDGRLNSAIQTMASAPMQSAAAASAVESPSTPSNKKGDTKTYNEGEALFSKKEFKKALVKFNSYREKNPKGAKASEATYKIGVCLGELGLKKEAKEIYQETIDNFPGTSSAKKAKFRLTQVK
jgi:TolA-binding protein